jgi:hypothetical protein
MKILQMNLIFLFKPHQSTYVIVLSIPSSNFLTIIKLQIFVIPLTQLAKNIYKLINHHIALVQVMHIHWMILLKCNIAKAKEKYHIAFGYFLNTFIRLMHEHNKFTIMQYLQYY